MMFRIISMMLMMMMMTVIASAVANNKDWTPASSLKRAVCSYYCLPVGASVIPRNISSDTEYVEMRMTNIPVIPRGAFTDLRQLRTLIILLNKELTTIAPFAFAGHPLLDKITISANEALESIGAFAFSDLPELREITITLSKHLRHIDRDAFKNLVNLRRLFISNTGLTIFPDFSKIHSAADCTMFDINDNIHIQEVPANAFNGLCRGTIRKIRLTTNGIKKVAKDAFNGTKLHNLSLRGNRQLAYIHPNAFAGSSDLVMIDVSHTALDTLPVAILGRLQWLKAESAFRLKELPPQRFYGKLLHANVTYPSHCCVLLGLYKNNSMWHPLCSTPKAREEAAFFQANCVNISTTCTPLPDAFNLCGDIMDTSQLRALIWIVSILTLLGNMAVLLVLLGSRSKLTVPRFLMCHLAFADLCMGVYLVVIATVDTLTQGHFYNHAIYWQTGPGCGAAGFFTVFASELSVFTLTVITLERWHTITHALRPDRKLRLRHACGVMAAGWIFSLLAALLPTMGVSSYSKVSICLPMDVESAASQVYVVSLLLLNILAFACVCGCYLSIYLTMRNPSAAPAHADAHVAQRMAVLVFTDFLCMAPISFFAVSAALKLPLITVSDAKLLLVIFYPINSCSNPFLYAFFTRSFRRDFFLLAARFGVFKTRAHIYRTESSSCQPPAWTSPKSSPVIVGSLANSGREQES
ncbi:LOW QUALITY PROTEIN: follicle-stimulating hormone receptor [Entelurus aequoreus]|uniref:LOW QUALITY PROTEIN: follicle-stimulating hormone receptor n=1 Tax=Entelurus aequoreus TaxID=161455 RepID=UPI002B1DEEDA|nr:LOW QUALITY PROTEIN: follicle-stimulating hormone receptor [Entelurus aequoreus]